MKRWILHPSSNRAKYRIGNIPYPYEFGPSDLLKEKIVRYLYVRNNVHIFAAIRLFDMTTTTATNFRSNVKKYLDLVINDSQEVIISRGSESAVLIPLDQFNAIKETEYLMSSKEMERVVLQGMEDVKNGNFKEVDIDEL